MAYDEDLADRIRELMGPERALTEMRMFGGLAFLINGHMALAASSHDGIMVRVAPAQAAELIESGEASEVEMRGSVMKGWVRVAPERLSSRRQLARWVELGIASARSLPPKTPRGGRQPPG